MTGKVRLLVLMSEAKLLPERAGALSGVETDASAFIPEAAPLPGVYTNVAAVASSGLERRSAGYAVSSWLTSSVEAEDFESATPSAGRTTISFHPIRSE